MIKFFRKIRRKLLSENKFTKYLLYIIGEIILVIIGILIALQVNNKNIQNQQNQKFITDLSKLVADLNKDNAQIDSLIQLRQTDLKSSQLLIETYIDNQPISTSIFFTSIRQVTLEHKFIQNTQGISLIKEAKMYNSKNFKNIRTLLESYNDAIEVFTFIEENLNVVTEKLELELFREGQFQLLYKELYLLKKGTPEIPPDIPNLEWTKWIKNSMPFKGLIHRVEDDIDNKILPQYKLAQTRNLELKNQIEVYLNQPPN